MEGLLAKIYDKIICNESDSIELGRRFDEEVTEIVKPLRQDMSDKEVERIREIIYEAAYTSEKQGFYLGVHTALKFMTEATNILDEFQQQNDEADKALFFFPNLRKGGDSLGVYKSDMRKTEMTTEY